MTFKFFRYIPAVFLALSVAVLGGCAGGGKTDSGGENGGSGVPEKKNLAAEQVFRLNLGTEPETLDPALMTGSLEGMIVGGLIEGLVELDMKTLQPKPGMARSWDLSEDGRTYTFHLRKDVKWTNGDPHTAHDYHYAWKRALEPLTAADYSYMLYSLVNAKEYNTGALKDFDKVGVKVIDDYTLEVTLTNPTHYFLELAAFHTLLPVNQKCIEAFGDKWTRPENIVTNGPFLLKEWAIKDKIVEVKNPDYFDAANVTLERIEMYSVEDNITSHNMFKAGETDWTRTVPLAYIDEVMDLPETHITDFLSTYYYRFNVDHEPLNDVRVRKALNLALDKQLITDFVTKAGQKPATTFVPPNMPNYTVPKGLEHNPDEARRLLKEAGFKVRGEDGPGLRDFPEIELLYNTSEGHKKIAEAITAMWKDELGIRVQPNNVEWKVYLKNTQAQDYDIGRAGWIGDYADPVTFLDLWVTDGGNNQTGWSNAEYDSLLKQAEVETDSAKRMKLLQRAEEILVVEELPILPIYYYVNVNLLKTYVKGVDFNLRDLHLLKYAWIEAH